MWELWVHLDHDHLYIPLTFKNDNFQLQTNIFPGNNSEWYFSVFLLILLLCGSRFMKKKHQLSRFEKSLLLSLSLGSKYGHLMLPGVFPDKVTPNIDFTNKTVVQ